MAPSHADRLVCHFPCRACGLCVSREHQDGDYIALLIFPAYPFFFLGLGVLACTQKWLIRIDSSHIVCGTWIIGLGETKKIVRPETLELFQSPAGNWQFFKGQPATERPAANYEITWLRKVLEEFERDDRHRHPCEGRGLVNEVMPCQLDSHLRGNDEHNPDIQKESGRTVRTVLKTMEYHGKPLERVWHPYENRKRNEAERPDHEAIGLYVRCPACNAALPNENVWFEEAAGQCPDCRLIFQIDDLKERTPSQHCRLNIWEDAAGLHLHQKPKYANPLTIYLAAIILGCCCLYGIIAACVGDWISVLLNMDFLRPVGSSLLLLTFFVVFTIRTYHVHRFIDFDSDTVRFRTRWLFWERCRSVSRCDIGTFRGCLLSEFFGGVVLPYSKRRSFYILATPTEQAYLNSTVNRWRWQNPIHLAGTPIALGGLGEEERALQMFCPHCGRQFSGEEVNVQNRESAILCPKCQQTFRLSEMYRFVPEPILGLSEAEQCTLPELPELRTEQNEDTLTVTYTPSPTLKKILGIFGAEIFFTLFFGTLFSLFVFLVFGMSGEERQKGFFVAMTVCSAAFFMYFAVLPRVFYSMLEHYDAYRGLYASWSIQIDRYRFVIHRHYNGDSEMVSYDRREIRRICLKECNYSDFPSPLWGRFPSLLCNAGRGGIELVLRDGTVECLPHITCITFNQHDRIREANNRIQNSRWVNYLNRCM